MSTIQAWAALARGERVTLTEAEATKMLNCLRASVLDGLPTREAAQLARAILQSTPNAPELFADLPLLARTGGAS